MCFVSACFLQDKGTLDALLCGDDDVRASDELLGEVWRLLAPGGAYVMITSGEVVPLIDLVTLNSSTVS